MWIETEDGKLVNLNFMEIIDALEEGPDTEAGIYALPPAHPECAVRTWLSVFKKEYGALKRSLLAADKAAAKKLKTSPSQPEK